MKAITLLSGGLDSMVSTAIARKKYKVILALTFDYGQRAAQREISAAKKMCRLWKIKHKVIKLPWLGKITKTALVNRRFDFSTVRSYGRTSARNVWVPNRNSIFISIAAAYAETDGAKFIVVGFNKEEAVTFPDNSLKFVNEINKSLNDSTMKHSKVISFVQNRTKLDMVRHVLKNDLPLNLCWSCYDGGKKPCGACESCVRFQKAYAIAIHR